MNQRVTESPAPQDAALLLGFAIIPGLMPRNKMFATYQKRANLKLVRARAKVLTRLAGEIVGQPGSERIPTVAHQVDPERIVLSLERSELKVKRSIEITPLEWAILRYLVARNLVQARDASAPRDRLFELFPDPAKDRPNLLEPLLRELTEINTDRT
ncbi:MAG: hypothetical protein KBF88_06945 [Polyangiaceae bacterium]|nr:hypothetical protein [Polyangiaceae bacterium]